MKLQPLYDLQQELNRLFVAGSRFAKNDPRLKKQLTVFEKLGEKAPVFKKIALGIEELSASDEKESAEKLTALSQLLYAVLYTQGESTEEGKEIKPQTPSIDYTNLGVDLNYRQISSIAKALTESGSGRLDVLEDALKKGVINNYRLFKYIDKALGDRYGELANFVAEEIIPAIGTPILPVLLDSLEYENTPVQQRRLKAIAKLNPSQMLEIKEKILEERKPLLTIELIDHLPKTIDNEEVFISLSKEKNKDLRAKAEEALGDINSKTSWKYLVDLFITKKKLSDIENLSQVLSDKNLPLEFIPELTKKIKVVFDDVLNIISEPKRDEKKLTESIRKLYIHTKPFLEKEDIEAANFLKEILKNTSFCNINEDESLFLSFDYNSISENICAVLGYNKMYDDIDELIKLKYIPNSWKCDLIRAKFIANSQCLDFSAEEIFNQFSEHYKKDIIASEDLYDNSIGRIPEGGVIEDYVDRRWLPLIEKKIKKNERVCNEAIELYVKLAGIDSPEAPVLLISLLNAPYNYKNFYYFEESFTKSLKLLLSTNYPYKYDSVFKVIEKKGKHFNSYYLDLLDTVGFSQFPKEYAQKFREIKVSGKNDVFEYIADIIEKA